MRSPGAMQRRSRQHPAVAYGACKGQVPTAAAEDLLAAVPDQRAVPRIDVRYGEGQREGILGRIRRDSPAGLPAGVQERQERAERAAVRPAVQREEDKQNQLETAGAAAATEHPHSSEDLHSPRPM